MNVAGQSAGQDMKPAGVFYFKIKELEENADTKPDTASLGRELEDRIAKSCRLEGIMVRDENILRAMDETIAPTETSAVLPLRQNKDGEIKQTASGELLTGEEFDELCNITMDHVRQICSDIQSGRIDIEPKKEKGTSGRYAKTACTYCAFKSICIFALIC
jgi:ATP-dependent helicase/nuclease subunit B